MRRSIDPIEIVGEEGSRPKSASRTIVSMSLRLAIPRQVALQHRLLPLRQPSVSLTKESLFEENKPFNGRCSYRKLSHQRGPPHAAVDDFVAACGSWWVPVGLFGSLNARPPAPKTDSGSQCR